MGLDYDPFNPQVQTSTVLQATVAGVLGLFAFLLFCILRLRHPKIYVANFNQVNKQVRERRNLPPLLATLFGWIPTLFRILEDDVLVTAGLDAVVFLSFFRFAIKTIACCLVLAYTVILPIRYHFTGRFDDEKPRDDHDDPETSYQRLQWLYTVFTYVITWLVIHMLFRLTLRIIDLRQCYLSTQDLVTDRTVKIQGIPPILREEKHLVKKIDQFGIGKVESILIVREWNDLNELFRLRRRILSRAEQYWIKYLNSCGIRTKTDLLHANLDAEQGETVVMSYRDLELSSVHSSLRQLLILEQITELSEPREFSKRPMVKQGMFGGKVDAINLSLEQLRTVDNEIKKARQVHYPASLTAFVTMDTVALAQLLAQAVVDPKANHFITLLAPAPHDILWNNLCMTRKEKNIRRLVVMLVGGFVLMVMLYLVVYLTKFLKLSLIEKVSPTLAEFLKAHPWAETMITRILPPYVFTIFNVALPYFFLWITEIQGYASHGDEELSAVSKIFFYNFVNLFLIFTLFGTVNLTDTGLIAKTLAEKLQELLVFYIHLVILLGVAVFPFKLLLVGNLLQYSFGWLVRCKTPRDYLEMYYPPTFNFGLQLPTAILVFIITILYLIMNLKILTAGLIYFVMGYYVFKYQLLYACVHPTHSTAKVWPMIFRRIIAGLLLFQLTMAGMLGLRQAYLGATIMAPLPIYTIYSVYLFERTHVPLQEYIALRALDEEVAVGRQQTVEEVRELHDKYEYPNLVVPLDGPMIAVDNNEQLVVQTDGQFVKKSRH